MQEKKNKLIQASIEILNPLIGYELCEDLKLIIYKTIEILCSNFNCAIEIANEIKEFLIHLFQINTYSDYLLLARNSQVENPEMLSLGKKYFSYLQRKDNQTHIFYKESFLAKLDREVVYGEPSSVRLKAYITLTGVFYPISKESAIVLLRKLVLFGDFFSLAILKKINDKNASKLEKIENCVIDMLYELKSEEYLKEKYAETVLENTKIIFVATQKQMEKNLIDHRLLNYLFNTSDSYEKKTEKIRKQNFEISKRRKVGY